MHTYINILKEKKYDFIYDTNDEKKKLYQHTIPPMIFKQKKIIV